MSGFALHGSTTVRSNQTGRAVHEIIDLPKDTVEVRFDKPDKVAAFTFNGSVVIGGFVEFQGNMGLRKTESVQGSDKTTTVEVGLADTSAFLGALGVGVKIEHVDLGFLLEQRQVAGAVTQGYALAGKGSAGMTGIPGFNLGGDFSALANTTGHAISNHAIQAGNKIVTLNFPTAEPIQHVAGHMKWQFAFAIGLEGDIVIEKRQANGQDSKLLLAAYNVNGSFPIYEPPLVVGWCWLSDGDVGFVVPLDGKTKGVAGSGTAHVKQLTNIGKREGTAELMLNLTGKEVSVHENVGRYRVEISYPDGKYRSYIYYKFGPRPDLGLDLTSTLVSPGVYRLQVSTDEASLAEAAGIPLELGTWRERVAGGRYILHKTPEDVSLDFAITPQDALVLINLLNTWGTTVPVSDEPGCPSLELPAPKPAGWAAMGSPAAPGPAVSGAAENRERFVSHAADDHPKSSAASRRRVPLEIDGDARLNELEDSLASIAADIDQCWHRSQKSCKSVC